MIEIPFKFTVSLKRRLSNPLEPTPTLNRRSSLMNTTPFATSPSKMAAYFLYKCDRQLHWSMINKQNVESISTIPDLPSEDEESKLMTALTSGGFDWEKELIEHVLVEDLVSVDGFVPKPKGKAFTKDQTFTTLQSIEIGQWIFQSTFYAPQSFYEQYNIDKNLIKFRDCYPDLITKTVEGRLRIVDAKASASIQIKHKIQVAIYVLLLEHILQDQNIDATVDMDTGGIWLGGDEEYTTFDLGAVLPHVRRLLGHDLTRVAKVPANEAMWHLYFECELCPWMKHCRNECRATNSVSRIPYLSPANKQYLVSENVALHTVDDVLSVLDNKEEQKARMANSGSLKAKGQRLYALAKSLKTNDIIPHGNIPFHLPKNEDIGIFLSIEKEPSTKQICAISVDIEVSPKAEVFFSNESRVFIASSADACVHIQQDFVRFLHEYLTNIHHKNTQLTKETTAKKRKIKDKEEKRKIKLSDVVLSAQFYTFEQYDQVNLIQLLTEVVETESIEEVYTSEFQDMAEQLLLYFRTSRASNKRFEPKQTHAKKFAAFPMISLLDTLKDAYALPIETLWRLGDVLTVFFPNHPISDVDFNHYELSNYLNTEIIHELWQLPEDDDDRILKDAKIKHIMKQRSFSLGLLLTEIRSRTDIQALLVTVPIPFELPSLNSTVHPIISMLSFISLNEVMTNALQTKGSRAMSKFEREITESVLSLRHIEGFTFWVDCEETELEMNEFASYLLWSDREEGEIDQTDFDDLAVYYRPPRYLPSTPHQLVCQIIDIVIDSDSGKQQITLGFNAEDTNWQGRVLEKESKWYLGSFYSNLLHSRIKTALTEAKFQKRLNTFTSLLQNTPASTTVDIHPLHTKLIEEMNSWGFAPSQQRVFQSIITQSMTLIWGPPGTGKSFVLAYSLAGLIKVHQNQGKPLRILVSAFTHTAINNLLKELTKRLNTLNISIPIFKRGELDGLPEQENIIAVERFEAFNQTTHDTQIMVYGGTSYAFGQISKTNTPTHGHAPIDYLIIDEGSQMTVPQAAQIWPLLDENTRVVIAGDHHQLPPIIAGTYPQPKEHEPLLTRSLFEAFQHSDQREKITHPSSTQVIFPLLEGWRMNSTLTQFSREELYTMTQKDDDGHIHSYTPATETVANQRIQILPQTDELLQFILDPEHPMVLCIFEDTDSVQENPHEAHLCTTITNAIRTSLLHPEHLYPTTEKGDQTFWKNGLFIVSPHHVQIREIQRQLNESREWLSKPFVDTVDKMQGQQSEVVLISYGVADIEKAENEAEFIYNRNRLNVSITRAKSKSIVMLSRQLLTGSAQLLDSEDASLGLLYMQKLEDWCQRGEKMNIEYEGKQLTIFRR
jgi:DNA replication ATP-dependent helicase Dna2